MRRLALALAHALDRRTKEAKSLADKALGRDDVTAERFADSHGLPLCPARLPRCPRWHRGSASSRGTGAGERFRADLAGHEKAKLEARKAWDSVDAARRADTTRSR